jgi:hypothetical protein
MTVSAGTETPATGIEFWRWRLRNGSGISPFSEEIRWGAKDTLRGLADNVRKHRQGDEQIPRILQAKTVFTKAHVLSKSFRSDIAAG